MKPADGPEHEQGDPPRRAAMNSALRRVGCVVSSAAMALAMLGSIGLADLVGAVSMSIVSNDREFDRNWIVGTTGIALCHVLVFFSSKRIAPVITVGVLIVAMASAFASGVEPLSVTATPLIVLLCSCGALAVIVCVMEFVAERRASQILRVITAWVGVALLAGVTFTVCDEVLRKTVRADGGSATISASPGRVVIYSLAVAILFALAHQRLRRQPAHSQAGRVQLDPDNSLPE